MLKHFYRQSMSSVLSAALFSNALYAEGIVVDTNALASHRASLDITANGIPLINIVTPNGNGLSHNKFSEFNVVPKGVILNNATSAVSTQLGGFVQGNANLGITPARTILSEVTGTSRTLLRGFTEVAGTSADIIIANPNGITVNGGGFINTPRATLATGTPSISAGTINSFHVEQGDILIEGSGMVAENIDRVELYSKALQINAEIHAKQLDIVTGSNTIARNGTVTSDNVTESTAYSVDSSALGGIYANTIRLIGTDHGVGVNLPPIAYATDTMELNAQGHIVVKTATAENTFASTSSSIMVEKKLYSKDASITASATATNDGAIIADTLRITGGDMTNNGGIIGSDSLSMDVNNLTNNEVLYGAASIDLKVANTLRNTAGSYITSAGAINIHDSGTVMNEAATIQADGTISIQASALENLSNMIPTKTNTATTAGVMDYFAPDFRDHRTTTTATDTIQKSGYTPSYILSSGDMSIDAAIHNRYSLIATDGDLYLSGSLNNEAALNAHTIVDVNHYVERWEKHGPWYNRSWGWHHYSSYYEHSDTITDHIYSMLQAGGSIYGNLTSINNADIVAGSHNTNISSTGIPASSTFTDIVSLGGAYTLPSGSYGSFITVTNPALPYLIESNPLYTNYNTFIGSDYMMSRLHLNMAADTKRLGDARYETQLVRDAVFRLTGERYLAGFGTDTAQYQALMDNAINVAEDLHLALGISLTSTQLASLDRDILWMEERVIAGQKVLVPTLYLASLKNSELSAGGKIVAGGDMALAVAGEVNNGGALRAGGTLAIASGSITNTAGTITSGNDMLLHTTNDITNTSGKISGNNVALISDNGSITSQTTSQTIDLNGKGVNGKLGTVRESAGIWSLGNLIASADKDINLVGSHTAAGGNIDLNAKNITLASLEQASQYKTTWKQGSSEVEKVTQHASTLNANGNVNMNAANDATINSSSINGKDVSLSAGNNINITASNNRDLLDVKTSSKGFMSKKSTRDTTLKESVVASAISGDNIQITSSKDTTLQASNLKAINNIQVDAGGDINLLAKAYREATLHKESKSSFGGLSKSMSLDSTDSVKLKEATVQTEAKNIIMNSGRDINIVASEVISAADIELKAFENLNIAAGEQSKSETHLSKKSSFNPLGLISLVDPLMGALLKPSIYTQEIHKQDNYDTTAKSSVISAGGDIKANTGTTSILGSNLSAEGDVSIKADIGGINITTAQELHNASALDKKVNVKLTDIVTSTVGALQGLSNDTKLKFNLATAQFDESAATAKSVTNVGSLITSGKSITIDSSDDLTIKGSSLNAKDDIALSSKIGNIAITESIDTTDTQSKEKHAKADVSFVVQNEFVETAVAVNNVVKAVEQLKRVKEDYSNYKREVKKLEVTMDTLKTDSQVSETDIATLQSLIAMTKSDEAYYLGAIAAATLNLASRSVAVAQQVEAAGASTATYGFSAGVSLDMKGSQTTSSMNSTKSNASNLAAKNIAITTDTSTNTATTISGSNLDASDEININTYDLSLLASKDTTNASSKSKDISGSVSMTIYGAGSGPQVSLGLGENDNRSDSATYTNSTLNANTINITTSNDATFKGATVRADKELNLNVGNNLEVASVQDTSSSSNHGFNISGGFGLGSDTSYANTQVGARTGNGSVTSANGSIGASNGRSYDTQTVLTSLTGNNVNLHVNNNTSLSGAVIAATDNQGNDTGNLNLSTKTLTTENLTDTHYNSNTGFSVGANVALTPTAKDPKPDDTSSKTKINSEHMTFNTSTDTSADKTLATVGSGTLTVGDTQNSTDTANLNRDVTKVDKELYSSNTGTKVDATLDTRLLTEKGRAQIKQEYKAMNENMNIIAGTLPDAASDNQIEAVVGETWNTLTKCLSLGLIPSNENRGGILAEIPILTGEGDSKYKRLLVVNELSDKFNQNDYIKMEDSNYFKALTSEDKAKFNGKGLYLSKVPVEINTETATYQNSINGMMNSEAEAIKNGLEQTGQFDIGKPVELTVGYNPSYGMISDLLESAVDKSGIGTTGIAKQIGQFVNEVTTIRGSDGSNIAMHSQANAIVYNGIQYVQTTAGFQPVEYFYVGLDKKGNKIYNLPTFGSFGSPMNGEDMSKLIADPIDNRGLGYGYSGAYTKPDDFVGEVLGGNSENNGQATLLQQANILNAYKLFTSDSPHGTYICQDYAEFGVQCGYRK